VQSSRARDDGCEATPTMLPAVIHALGLVLSTQSSTPTDERGMSHNFLITRPTLQLPVST